jgi:hypothetical protein
MVEMPGSIKKARGILDTARWFLMELPAKQSLKSFDYSVAEGQMVIEMKSPTDYRVDLTLKLTTEKKKISTIWFRMPEGQLLGAMQDRKQLAYKKTPEYLGLPLAKPLTKGQPVSIIIRYRFQPGDFGMIPMPISPQLKYPLTVVGKCGEGYDLIFPGTHIKTETVMGLKNYTWEAPRPYQLHLLALHSPKRISTKSGEQNFYYYFHAASEPNAKAVVDTLAEAYIAQVKLNGPLAYKDYYIIEVSPKACPNPMGLGGIILVPNGQFKMYDQARANGILENILLREWQGRKGEVVKQSRERV